MLLIQGSIPAICNVPLDEEGYIMTNGLMETKLPEIVAASDVCCDFVRQKLLLAIILLLP